METVRRIQSTATRSRAGEGLRRNLFAVARRLTSALVLLSAPLVQADSIVLDNFTPTDLSDDTTLIPTGSLVEVTEAMGRRPLTEDGSAGANLFHSFLRFGIDAGQTALFTQAADSAPIANVIARVSGGAISQLDGTLASAIEGADFWLVNPAGVIFGQDAVVDIGGTVPGSFNVGASDYLVFADAQTMAVDTPSALLSVSAPSQFGFMQGGGGTLTLNGTQLGQLSDTGAHQFDGVQLVGRSVQLNNTDRQTQIHSVAGGSSRGDITLQGLENVSINGQIATQTNLSGASANAGAISLRGGRIELFDGGELRSDLTSPGGDAGQIELIGTEIALSDGARLTSGGSGRGTASTILLSASDHIAANFDPATGSIAPADTAEVVIGASAADTADLPRGRAPQVQLEAPTIALANTRIDTRSRAAQAGAGRGDVGLQSIDELLLVDTLITTQSDGATDAGDVSLISLDGDVTLTRTAINASTDGTGTAGDVLIGGRDVEINLDFDTLPDPLERGIHASSRSNNNNAHAGNIEVAASRDLTVRGVGYDADTDDLRELTNPREDAEHGDISAAALGRRTNAGAITLTAGGDLLISGAVIDSLTNQGVSSLVDIRAENIDIDNSLIQVLSGDEAPDTNLNIEARNRVAIGNLSSTDTVFGPDIDDTDFTRLYEQSLSRLRVSPGNSRQSGRGGSGALRISGRVVVLDQVLIENPGGRLAPGGDVIIRGDEIHLDNRATIEVQAARNDGGNIDIHAETLVTANRDFRDFQNMTGSLGNDPQLVRRLITLNARGNRRASDSGGIGSIRLSSDADIDLTFFRAVMENRSPNFRPTQSLLLSAPNGTVRLNRAAFLADARGSSDGSSIRIEGRDVLMLDPRIESEVVNPGGNVSLFTPARGGDISIVAEDSLVIADVRGGRFSIISADSLAGNTVAPGRIELIAGGDLEIRNTTISTSSESNLNGINADGDAPVELGTVTLMAGGELRLIETSVEAGASGDLAGGDVQISATDVLVVGTYVSGSRNVTGGGISASTAGRGAAGSVRITATDGIRIEQDGSLEATTVGRGAGGDVSLDAPSIELHAARVSTSTRPVDGGTRRPGPAGSIEVNAPDRLAIVDSTLASTTEGIRIATQLGSLLLSSGGPITIQGSTVETSTRGRSSAGRIEITAPTLEITEDSLISAESAAGASGSGGEILLSADAGILISGAATRVSSATLGAGDGGAIAIDAGSLQVINGGVIETIGLGEGASGDIDLNIRGDLVLSSQDRSSLDEGSALRSSSALSSGGDIRATVLGTLQLKNSSIVTSVAADSGSGGDVSIQAASLQLEKSQILARADAGNGGQITIEPPSEQPQGTYVLDAASRVDAESRSGESGTVRIENPDTAVNSVVTEQSASVGQLPELDTTACGLQGNEQPSSLRVSNLSGYAPPPPDYSGGEFDEGGLGATAVAATGQGCAAGRSFTGGAGD